MFDYTECCAAIVRRAVLDYGLAARKGNFGEVAKLERFFLSQYGQLLSNGHGEYIIERCRNMYKKYLQNFPKKD